MSLQSFPSDCPPACSSDGSGRRCAGRRAEGRGATGCAFRGAKMALQPIADVLHLVHGPASCEAGSWEFRPTLSSGPALYRTSFSSDIGEMDIVRGGEARLFRAIGEAVARFRPPAVFVYQTCLPAMIGDDINAVSAAAAKRWSLPVIAIDAPGFAGSRPYGNHLAAEALLSCVIGTREPSGEVGDAINLIGEFNLAGELGRIRPLLARLGIRVLASISGDGRFSELQAAHRAKASLLLCSQGLASLAEGLEMRWDIPLVRGSFHGIANTSETLRRLADLLVSRGGRPDLPARAEALIAAEEARVAATLAACRRRFAGKRALLISGGVKTWSLAATLVDAGFELIGTAAHKTSRRDRRKLLELLEGDAFRFEAGAVDLPARLRALSPDIVLSGGPLQHQVVQAGLPWVEVNHNRTIALSGYDGTLALLAEIDRALANPVWRAVTRPAPWAGEVKTPARLFRPPAFAKR